MSDSDFILEDDSADSDEDFIDLEDESDLDLSEVSLCKRKFDNMESSLVGLQKEKKQRKRETKS